MSMKVVGVLHLAPDGGLRGSRLGDSAGFDPREAVDRGRRLLVEGADIVEVCDGSGEGFAVLSADDDESVIASPSGSRLEDSLSEQVLEVIAALSEETRVSISTISSSAALSAVEAGASIIRDTSGALLETASFCGAGWVAVHSGSGRATLAKGGILEEVSDYVCELAEQASRSGIAEFYFDPGFGVGKSFEESFDLLAGLEALTERCSSVLVDVDCRGFAAALPGRRSALPPGSEAVSVEGGLSQTGRGEMNVGEDGALAMAAWAVSAGVAALRCREVAAAVDVARTLGAKPPAPQSASPSPASLPPSPFPASPQPAPQSAPLPPASVERRRAPASRLEVVGR